MTTPNTDSAKTAKTPDRTKRIDPNGPAPPQALREQQRGEVCDSELAEREQRAALWANPAFQAALEEGRESFARGEGKPLEQLEQEDPLTAEQIAEAEAWLDEYERRLEREERDRQRAAASRAPADASE